MEGLPISLHTNVSCQESPGIKDHAKAQQPGSESQKEKILKISRTHHPSSMGKENPKQYNVRIFFMRS